MHGNRVDIPVVFQSGPSYHRDVDWGGMSAAFWGFPAGFDSSPLFKGFPDGCQCPHWGYLFKGRMRVKYADHEEVIDQACKWAMPSITDFTSISTLACFPPAASASSWMVWRRHSLANARASGYCLNFCSVPATLAK